MLANNVFSVWLSFIHDDPYTRCEPQVQTSRHQNIDQDLDEDIGEQVDQDIDPEADKSRVPSTLTKPKNDWTLVRTNTIALSIILDRFQDLFPLYSPCYDLNFYQNKQTVS